jgi:hypothetical protein
MAEAIKTQIVDLIKELLLDLASDIGLRPMYGGTVIELKAGDSKSRVGGIYVYADHVSLEFTKGGSLDDPKSVLEGTGKLRRHLKLRTLQDIHTKDCRSFLKQAISEV